MHGGKHLENRRWNTKFRGEFYIHAAKGMTKKEYQEAVTFAQEVAGPAFRVPGRCELDRACLIGKARLVDVLPPCFGFEGDIGGPAKDRLHMKSAGGKFAHCNHPWHMPSQFGFMLKNVTPIASVPLKGMLGFFSIPPDIAERLS